ncbi:DUF4192 domain-containing protein [Rhodococcus opacus]|uniref:DUF4192 domain-containing protein n=1 Tax=Rhodococcus opacus (strain B4) TaxID=632772 RepID=C1B3C3_RHOOB|nr:DUF4192 domain-containing protein [Rhodococcus opacus]BAH55040.1 hypothetical protein ROP_67930 [Rhodococcus opacus B4]
MTTPAFPHGSGFSDDPGGEPPPQQYSVTLSAPGDLLASVPALLGFRPARSIVAVCLNGKRNPSVGAVMRHDLVLGGAGDPTPTMYAALGQFATVCERDRAGGVILVLVDDRFTGPSALCLDELSAIVEEFEELLDFTPTDLLDVFVTAEIASGGAWFSLFGGNYGVQSDPASSRVALARVLEGKPIRASREEMEATIEVGPVLERMQIAALIERGRPSSLLRRELAERSSMPDRCHRLELELVLTHVARVSSGERLLAPEYAELALALDNVTVRDSVLALAVGPYAEDAEQLWILLARNLPDPERANPAALLGYSAYLRGDGPFAGIALAAALDAEPGHVLATLLDGALHSGMRPAEVRGLAGVGYERASAVGVALPPPLAG